MASRRDQLQSYQFLVQRVISALVMRQTDPAQAPLRRGIGAVFAGAMILVILSAGFAVYGLFTKVGSRSWKVDGAVVIEKETGAAYVYLGGSLHPMLNYASALLASGQPGVVFRESRNSLTGVPRGVALGIDGAPASLPDRHSVIGSAWTLCAVPGADEVGNVTTKTVLLVGQEVPGGRALNDQALLVRSAGDKSVHLIWHSHRYRLNRSQTVLPSLFGAQATVVDVGAAWLNGLPEGAGIGPISVPGKGTPSQALPGRTIGDLMVAQMGSGPQAYLVFGDGLVALTELQKDIVLGESTVQPVQITASEANAAKKSGTKLSSDDETAPPKAPPALTPVAGGRDPVCARQADARAAPMLMVGGGVAGGQSTSAGSTTGATLADRVVVPPGRVAVVRIMASPTATAGSYTVVTDLGIRYPVSSLAALALLGYRPGDAVDMPASLVSRITAGPTLDPEAARQAAAVTPVRPTGG